MRGVALRVAILAGSALLLGAACSRPSGDAPASAGSAPLASASAAAPLPEASWSREALAPHGGSSDPVVPAVMGSIDRGALDDLLAAAPKGVTSATAADGGTMVGANTGVPDGSASPIEPPPPEAPPQPRVMIGAPQVQAAMANPAIERAMRAQLYWGLVQRCRDKSGKILPADAVTMHFTVDTDGYITPASIVARAAATEHEGAAHCMRRELSTATFRAPAATWGRPVTVTVTLPSVD